MKDEKEVNTNKFFTSKKLYFTVGMIIVGAIVVVILWKKMKVEHTL